MEISGTTPDNKRVIKGAFAYTGTYGIPLEDVLFRLKYHDVVIDWIDWCTFALKDGWLPKTIRSKVLSAISETYGPKYLVEFEPRFNTLIGPSNV